MVFILGIELGKMQLSDKHYETGMNIISHNPSVLSVFIGGNLLKTPPMQKNTDRIFELEIPLRSCKN